MLANARLQTLVCTSRMDEAELFYRDRLGLPLKGRSVGALVFDVGGADLRVSPVPDWTPSEHTAVGFAVEDIEAAVRQLGAAGLTFARFDHLTHASEGIVEVPDGARVAWFRDPDGNILSLVQYASGEVPLTL